MKPYLNHIWPLQQYIFHVGKPILSLVMRVFFHPVVLEKTCNWENWEVLHQNNTEN